MSERFQRWVFLLGALFNVVVGACGVLFYELTVTLLFGADALTDALIAAVFYRLFMVAVIVFGIGYTLVARDLASNRGIVWLGAGSKLVIAGVLCSLVATGQARLLILGVVLPDLGFMVLFFHLLWQTRAR